MTNERREYIFWQRVLRKCTSAKQQRKRRLKKTRQKLGCQLLLSKEIILGHPCVPRVRLTRLVIRTEAWETWGRAGKGGGGRGRYEAQRVNAGFHVITCDLTATASHLLVSAVPWIRITAPTALCIYVIYTNSWINTARPNIVWIQSGSPWAVRCWQTGRRMALTAIEGVSQWGVVGCSGSRTYINKILVRSSTFADSSCLPHGWLSSRLLRQSIPFLSVTTSIL